MTRLFAGILCLALLAQAQAGEGPPAPTAQALAAPEVLPGRLGYAFDRPEILLRQRLFGLAHGVSLLAAACLDLPAHARPVQQAYAAWHARQGEAIDTLARDLAAYYFGPRAPEALWPDLVRALNLGGGIDAALGEIRLPAACASLPEALRQPRYEFDKLLATPEPAVPPAPTVEKRAE